MPVIIQPLLYGSGTEHSLHDSILLILAFKAKTWSQIKILVAQMTPFNIKSSPVVFLTECSFLSNLKLKRRFAAKVWFVAKAASEPLFLTENWSSSKTTPNDNSDTKPTFKPKILIFNGSSFFSFQSHFLFKSNTGSFLRMENGGPVEWDDEKMGSNIGDSDSLLLSVSQLSLVFGSEKWKSALLNGVEIIALIITVNAKIHLMR